MIRKSTSIRSNQIRFSFIILFSYLQLSHALTVHFHNGTIISLPYVYATIGTPPTTTLLFPNISILFNKDINSNECTIYKNVFGELAIYRPRILPEMGGCCTDSSFGNAIALARTVQGNSGRGLLLHAGEKYREGKVLGFENSIKIPVVVLSSEVMSYLAKNHELFYCLELAAVTAKENDELQYLDTMFFNSMLAFVVIYGVLMLIMAFTLIIHWIRFYKSSRNYKPYIVLLKLGGLATSTCTFLWLTVDPFGFKHIMWWKSCTLFYIQQGCFTSICLLVLLLLLCLPTPNTLINHPKRMATVIYISIGVIMLLSFAQGVICSNAYFLIAMAVVYVTAIIAISIGFIFFAKETVIIFMKSKNRAKCAKTLPVKVTLFSLNYIIVQYVVAIVALKQPFGHIISVLVVTILGPFMFFVMFIVLFFPTSFLYSCFFTSQNNTAKNTVLEEISKA